MSELLFTRPRRTARLPSRIPETTTAAASVSTLSRTRRKTKEARLAESLGWLQHLLKNPQSKLTQINISDLINIESWSMLSPDAQAHLVMLLPPTAFFGYTPVIEPNHPSCVEVLPTDPDLMDVDQPLGNPTFASSSSFALLDPAVFTDPHFLAAAHTFQDHIYSGWMSDVHVEKVKQFEAGVRDGSLAAPWKDEVWELNNAVEMTRPTVHSMAFGSPTRPESSARAGDAAELKLVDLAKNGVILTGDVVAYRRNFSHLDLVVEKDIIIESIHPRTHAVTVLLEPGMIQYLSAPLVTPDPPDPSPPTQSMEVTSPSMLENGLLDMDGRVDRARRPNGNAWKTFTVWRWRGEAPEFVDPEDRRGGRENHGTLFYLRGSYYHDR